MPGGSPGLQPTASDLAQNKGAHGNVTAPGFLDYLKMALHYGTLGNLGAGSPESASGSSQTPASKANNVVPSNPYSDTAAEQGGQGFTLNNQQESQYLQQNFNYYIWTGETRVNTAHPGGGRLASDEATTTPAPTLGSDYIRQWQDGTRSQGEIAALQQRLINAGLMPASVKPDGMWNKNTEQALATAMAWSADHASDPSATVDAYINQKIAYNEAHGQVPGADRTITRTSVNLTDPEQAKGLLFQTLQQYLGHMPTSEEVAQFTNLLNERERANPDVTTTVQGYNPTTGFMEDKNSTTTAGFHGEGQAAIDYARAQPGSAEFQTATSYMDAFEQALKG